MLAGWRPLPLHEEISLFQGGWDLLNSSELCEEHTL